MTQANDLLAKIINEQSLNALREVPRDWLQGAEVTTFDFIQSYIGRYGRMPDREVLAQNGYELPFDRVEQPIDYYRDVVSNRFILATATEQSTRLINAAHSYDINQVRLANMELMRALSLGNTAASDLVTLHEAAEQALETSRRAFYRNLAGYPTGWEILDSYIGGWQQKDVNIMVGRPGTGKTYFLLKSVMENWLAGNPVLVVSLEMSAVQMAIRLISMMMRLNPNHFKLGEISTWVRQDIHQMMVDLPVNMPPFHFLVAETKKTIHDVEAIMDRVDPAAVYIDAGYLLVTENSKYSRTRRETIADTIESMKGLAVRSDKAFLSTVQFNRNVKTGKKKNDKVNEEMSIEDIGETDVIGQVAYSITGIHPPPKSGPGRRKRKIQLLKNRDGELVTFNTNFLLDPPNFDYIETVVESEEPDDTADRQEAVQGQRQNLSWM